MENIERVYDILDFTDCEEVMFINVNGTNLHVYYTDEDANPTEYVADMNERPQALDYVLGKRDDFDD